MTEQGAHDRYLEEIHRRHDRLLDLYDRTILTLSGGALALSVTFNQNLVAAKPVGRWLLGWSWGFLVVSVIAIAFSYLPSIIAHEATWDGDTELSRSRGNVAWYASVFAGIAFAVGLALMARYAYINL